MSPAAGEFSAEQNGLEADIRRFIELSEKEPERLGLHPMFGPQPLKKWQRMHGMHFDHHLRQFGV
ncbi:MAG TPA: DUF1569 domain-containing protein [Planctomycetota bacterium]|nr:DUF1569 domain-containing protein [Planctomycetota bacterium]